jgi:uncharacterized protein with PhoU and TrkA domain
VQLTAAPIFFKIRFCDKGVMVVAMRRASGESVFNPPATTILESGDVLQVLSLASQLDEIAATAKTG